MDLNKLNQYRALLAKQEQEREEFQRLLARETMHDFVPTYQPQWSRQSSNGIRHHWGTN